MSAHRFNRCLEVDHVGEVTVANFIDRDLLSDALLRSFAEQLAELSEDVGGRQLLLNFGNLKHFTSQGLSSVIACHQKLQAAGGRLVVCNLNPPIYEVFKSTKLDNLLTVEDCPPGSEEETASVPEAVGTVREEDRQGRKGLPIVLCDPRRDRAGQLLAALGRHLSVVHLTRLDALDHYCARHAPTAVALPLHWPPSEGEEGGSGSAAVLDFIRSHGRHIPAVVYADTPHLPLEKYCQALAAGARQVINEASPGFARDLTQVLTRIAQAHLDDLAERERLTAQFAAFGLIGRSRGLREVFSRAVKAGYFSDLPVLILGETGTGKQRLAEAIHHLDPRRRDRAFLTVHCPTISKTLAESELFGHTRGAFSGAGTERLGLFRAANGGTLLLDEIGELDPDLQPKLLRVLQERRLLPVGADYEHAVDVRLIAATNRPLDRMVAAGEFREDLYQRLNVFQVRIPPLRERPEDIEVQAEHFLTAYQAGRAEPVTGFGPRVLEVLRLLPWEGNTRQLENFIREALAHKEGGGLLQMEDLPRWVLETLVRSPELVPAGDPLESLAKKACERRLTLSAALDQYEERLLREALEANGGNRTRTAAQLGLTPRSIFNKIKKYRIDRAHIDPRGD